MEQSKKAALLVALYKNEGLWEDELIFKVMEQEGLSSDYWKWTFRYYLIELAANGLIEPTESKFGDDSNFGPDHSVSKYKVTGFGADKVEGMLL